MPTNRAIDLQAGDYRITVMDNIGFDAGCQTVQDFIRHLTHGMTIIIAASATNQITCSPDGTAQIDAISEDLGAVAAPFAGWNIRILDNARNDITSSFTQNGTPGDPFGGLAAGSYFIQTQNASTECFSDPFPIEIEDISADPVIMIDINRPQFSLNPNPASWTGELKSIATEMGTGLPDPMGYTYAWYSGLDTSTPVISGLDSASSLGEGEYTVQVRNINTGCESVSSTYLPFVRLIPTFDTYQYPKTVCAPANGSSEVTAVYLESNVDLLSDYTFNWYDNDYNDSKVPDYTVSSVIQPVYQNLNSGSYYIKAQENWWMLSSYPIKVEVIDSTTNPIIVFDATNYRPLTSCDENVFADGQLAVDVFEDSSNPYIPPGLQTYGYSWVDLSTNQIIPGQTSNLVSGLKTGNYRVMVMNMGNNCESEKVLSIEDESLKPVVVASQTPNLNCPIELSNGIAYATVINSDNPYTYNWYNGSATSGTPVYTGPSWTGRPEGTYTVIATDIITGTCFSEPVLIEVGSDKTYPVVLINEISPVTNCDPTRPNGILSALTQDGTNNHTFEWYLDGNLYFSGSIPTNIGLQDYELVVTNNVTKCSTSMVGRASQLLGIVPPPDVSILQERTSCNAPDGIATASISGTLTDHIFRFYNSNTQAEITNYYNDFVMYNLDTSSYYVVAEERSTGCQSDSTVFRIADDTYFPEFELVTEPSSCEEPTGAADVILKDITRDYKVTWYNDSGFETQVKELVYMPMGEYRVDVEGTQGCITSMTVVIKGDVIIYNGVSANGDGFNDFLRIVCIENFPNNNVKIFNRGGLLVYEQASYDSNTEKRFEGISNKGLSLLGKELPIGTYFYVVDKSDGSKPKVGYLELVR
ncbi:MAG: gliding motility-associated C-terminal domain-containing protein [Cyclobacteriaceae bacterium]|nr:gliding motility-associated C-terminal domain-containing protein [Cyclobacteriaceae bacterium]